MNNYTQTDTLVYYLLRYRTKDTKLPLKDIVYSTKMSASTVKRSIKRLRLDGALICSDKNGYWWGNKHDLIQYVRELDNKISDMLDISLSLESAYEAL